MIEPPKFAVFLVVVTAHLAVLAFGFPQLSPAPIETAAHAENSLVSSHEAHDHASEPNGVHGRADENSAVNPAASKAQPTRTSATDGAHDHDHDRKSSEPQSSADDQAVPTLEQHLRQHGKESKSPIPHMESLAKHEADSPSDSSAAAEHAVKSETVTEISKLELAHLNSVPKPSALQAIVPKQAAPNIPTRPKPVQMITPEKPGSESSIQPKPVAVSVPKARPVSIQPAQISSSNRAGSARMKNLRPIK
jgi:hypothetical protein